MTRCWYRLALSRLCPLPLVIVRRIEVDTAKEIQNPFLPQILDVFGQRLRYSLLLGAVFPQPRSFRDQTSIKLKIRHHFPTVSCAFLVFAGLAACEKNPNAEVKAAQAELTSEQRKAQQAKRMADYARRLQY